MTHPFAQLVLPVAEPPTVALIFDDDGSVDRAYTWETGQSYALQGYRVVAVADAGHLTAAEAQDLYDAERARYRDCFGITD